MQISDNQIQVTSVLSTVYLSLVACSPLAANPLHPTLTAVTTIKTGEVYSCAFISVEFLDWFYLPGPGTWSVANLLLPEKMTLPPVDW